MTVPSITDQAPGVYWQDVFPPPAQTLLTGVPAFLGYTSDGEPGAPYPLTLWPQFETQFGAPRADGFLGYAVRGFFENGGLLCYVVPLDQQATALNALRGGLAALQGTDAVDLVCAPDIMIGASMTATPDIGAVTALQAEVLADCERAGGRFAILDAVLTADTGPVAEQRAALDSEDGALYYPWLWAPGQDGTPLYLPPCGHVAGLFAQTDQQVGVHKAPANEAIEGVLDLRANLTDDVIGQLYGAGVNCLRARPGRGIRVWGARTLSGDTQWQPVGARRVFLTMGRWLEQFLTELTFEPNDVRLWVRITREVTAYLDGLFQAGALQGSTPQQAFFVKCDSETNPPDATAAGMVVTQIGVALAAPSEFIVVRVINGTSGVAIQTDPATA
jgi:uncharacterized protein